LWAQGKEEAAITLDYMCEDLAKTYDLEVPGLCVIKNA
jgi:hypothetical protein